MKNFLLFLFCFILSACGGGSQNSGLTPLDDNGGLKDEILFEAITNFIDVRGAPPNSSYDYVRVDLDGDGQRDGLVLFKLPHTYWCGWDGCGLAVFRAKEKEFVPMSVMNGVRGPIYVNATGNHGWRDIIIRTSGSNMPDKNVVMHFDGRSYPSTPLLAPTLQQPLSSLRTEKYFR